MWIKFSRELLIGHWTGIRLHQVPQRGLGQQGEQQQGGRGGPQEDPRGPQDGPDLKRMTLVRSKRIII